MIEQLEKLTGDQTEEEILDILLSIPKESDFWFGYRQSWLGRPSYPYRVRYSDPTRYGQGVTPGVFPKIVNSIPKLGQNALAQATTAFSQACTKKEWTKFYRPILEGSPLGYSVPVHLFNKVAPPEHMIELPKLVEYLDFTRTNLIESMNTEVLVEPLDSHPRSLWIVDQDSVVGFDRFGAVIPEDHPIYEGLIALCQNPELNYPLGLEIYMSDPFEIRELFFPKSLDLSLIQRYDLLNDLQERYPELLFVETYQIKLNETGKIFGIFRQQGYQGMIVRPIHQSFPGQSIVVNPKKSTKLACVGFKEADGTVSDVSGIGKIGKKTVTGIISGSLTSQQKTLLYSMRQTLIGSELTVQSCGPNQAGELLFPILTNVKETQHD